MELDPSIILALLILLAAALYSAVGHAGASGYLAAMALFGLAPMEMKPAALLLNVFVATIATTKYLRAGRFSWQVFWPFMLASVPFAYIGGLIQLPGIYYKPVVGLVLIYAAFHFIRHAGRTEYQTLSPNLPIALIAGAGLGFLSGLVGVGGGIFLSPLLIMLRWEQVPKVSGIAAAFILVNSGAGLLGFMTSNVTRLPDDILLWGVAAVIGGYIGSELGSKRLDSPMIRRLLALVLLIAAVKMFATI